MRTQVRASPSAPVYDGWAARIQAVCGQERLAQVEEGFSQPGQAGWHSSVTGLLALEGRRHEQVVVEALWCLKYSPLTRARAF